ncbi:kinase-like domain-containing protein [Xylaria scruposa]|nr:kinase-like domain-containing protein [Xylaria scruposa]
MAFFTYHFIERYLEFLSLVRQLTNKFGPGKFDIKISDDVYSITVPSPLTTNELFEIRRLSKPDARRGPPPPSTFSKTSPIASDDSTSKHKGNVRPYIDNFAVLDIQHQRNPGLSSANTEGRNAIQIRLPLKESRINLDGPTLSRGTFSTVVQINVTCLYQDGSHSLIPVAIKHLMPIKTAKSLFEAESKALLRLRKAASDSISIVHILTDPYEREGEFAFVFPLARANLAQFMGTPDIDLAENASVHRQVVGLAEALSVIHNNLIAHGDLKPENILVFGVGASLKFKIADFGHSYLLDAHDNFPPYLGAYPLNPTYCAPELWHSVGKSTQPYDVWALGCILLELVTYFHEGVPGLQKFRDQRHSRVGQIVSDTFHDTMQLKPVVVRQLQILHDRERSGPIWKGIRRMLELNPGLRSTAAGAETDLRGAKEGDHVSSGQGYMLDSGTEQSLHRPFEKLRDISRISGLSLIQTLGIIVTPILSGVLIFVMAKFSQIRCAIVTFTLSLGTWIATIMILWYIGVFNPRSLYNNISHWAFPREICPVPTCSAHVGRHPFSFPDQWYRHLANEHHHNTTSTNQATSSSSIQTHNTMQGSNKTNLYQRQPQQSLNPNLGSPGHPSNTKTQNTQLAQALDLCVPDHVIEIMHKRKELAFKLVWTDDLFCQDLAEAYYRVGGEPRAAIYIAVDTLKSWLSFFHLSRVRITKFRVIQDPISKDLRALCLQETLPSPLNSHILNTDLVQRCLAIFVHRAWLQREKVLPTQQNAVVYFAADMGTIARNQQPIPRVGYEGFALEFVQNWNISKLRTQLLVALATFVIAGLVVGISLRSIEYGFLILGAGITISQLIVACLVFVIPPPKV